MFAFEIWGKFASFKDPFTISQNISFPIPPKTAIAGLMASILGVEEYLKDNNFKSFKYSIIPLKPIRKRSFSQNYINDYTKKSQTHLNNLKKRDFQKISQGFRDKKDPQKPINRELLLDIKYLVAIRDFKYQNEIVENLKNRISRFPIYLGNSEFGANFKYIEILEWKDIEDISITIDSFILKEDSKKIEFQNGVRYSQISFALNINENRTPLEFGNIIFANRPIKIKNGSATKININGKTIYCRFI